MGGRLRFGKASFPSIVHLASRRHNLSRRRCRCIGTFSNYLTHVRSASCACGHEPPPIGHPAIKRAMGGIAKRMLFSPRHVMCFATRRNGSTVPWCQAQAVYPEDHATQYGRQRRQPGAWRVVVDCLSLVAASVVSGTASKCFMAVLERHLAWA